jgi:hypothetical protein
MHLNVSYVGNFSFAASKKAKMSFDIQRWSYACVSGVKEAPKQLWLGIIQSVWIHHRLILMSFVTISPSIPWEVPQLLWNSAGWLWCYHVIGAKIVWVKEASKWVWIGRLREELKPNSFFNLWFWMHFQQTTEYRTGPKETWTPNFSPLFWSAGQVVFPFVTNHRKSDADGIFCYFCLNSY